MKERPVKIRPDVCSDCPFRIKHPAGWLGNNEPQAFIRQSIYNDASTACHEMMDQSIRPYEKWVEVEANTPRCRGAMIMRNNMGRSPRDLDAAKSQRACGKSDEIHSRPEEFIAKHEASRVKSWRTDEIIHDRSKRFY